MTITHKVKPGTDQALIDLVTITPQPASNGVEYTVRDDAIDGSVTEQGPHVVHRFDVMEEDADYLTLLTLYGLNTATTALVTVLAESELYVATRYNGLAVRPEKGRDVQRRNTFVGGVEIIIKNLTAAA
jgi:hypothetical protein